jgi:hypothetical protein
MRLQRPSSCDPLDNGVGGDPRVTGPDRASLDAHGATERSGPRSLPRALRPIAARRLPTNFADTREPLKYRCCHTGFMNDHPDLTTSEKG